MSCWQVAILEIPTSRKTTLTFLCLPVTWTWCGWLRHSPRGKCFIAFIKSGYVWGFLIFPAGFRVSTWMQNAWWSFTAGLGWMQYLWCTLSWCCRVAGCLTAARKSVPQEKSCFQALNPFVSSLPEQWRKRAFFPEGLRASVQRQKWKNYQVHCFISLGPSLVFLFSWWGEGLTLLAESHEWFWAEDDAVSSLRNIRKNK